MADGIIMIYATFFPATGFELFVVLVAPLPLLDVVLFTLVVLLCLAVEPLFV